MKPTGPTMSPKKRMCQSALKEASLRLTSRRVVAGDVPGVASLTATVSSSQNQSIVPSAVTTPAAGQTVEQKRLLIRKQLVILLHAIVCRRRDLISSTRGESCPQPCNVPFCGLMKTLLAHLNNCKTGRSCTFTHCASSRQILIHWKYCVKAECPVCVSLRQMVPTSLLHIFPNPLCRAEIMTRVARHQQTDTSQDQAVPELLDCEE